jgi:hypothetical protein
MNSPFLTALLAQETKQIEEEVDEVEIERKSTKHG